MSDVEPPEGGEVNNNVPKNEAWVQIQERTFCNWMNDKLRMYDIEVHDLKNDLKDGVLLCKLMNSLKGKSVGKIKVRIFVHLGINVTHSITVGVYYNV